MTIKHGVARHKGTQDVIVISENLIANRVQGFVIVTSSAPAGVIILT